MFFTADDHERLIHRPKPLGDESVPAGNGVAAQVLQRLGWLLAEPRYLMAAERTLRIAWSHVTRMPHGHCALLVALQDLLDPCEILVLRGPAHRLAEWQQVLVAEYRPNRLVFAIPDGASLPDGLAGKESRGDGLIYRCVGTRCDAPVTAPEAVRTG